MSSTHLDLYLSLPLSPVPVSIYLYLSSPVSPLPVSICLYLSPPMPRLPVLISSYLSHVSSTCLDLSLPLFPCLLYSSQSVFTCLPCPSLTVLTCLVPCLLDLSLSVFYFYLSLPISPLSVSLPASSHVSSTCLYLVCVYMSLLVFTHLYLSQPVFPHLYLSQVRCTRVSTAQLLLPSPLS